MVDFPLPWLVFRGVHLLVGKTFHGFFSGNRSLAIRTSRRLLECWMMIMMPSWRCHRCGMVHWKRLLLAGKKWGWTMQFGLDQDFKGVNSRFKPQLVPWTMMKHTDHNQQESVLLRSVSLSILETTHFFGGDCVGWTFGRSSQLHRMTFFRKRRFFFLRRLSTFSFALGGVFRRWGDFF